MPKCSYCNSSILFGGVREGEHRFCNRDCYQRGALLTVSNSIPDDVVAERVRAVHQGPCPVCAQITTKGIDVHTSHSIFSAVFFTQWKSTPRLSCTPCGKKAKMTSAVSSFFLGWWGIPWGLILTPIQVGRNVFGLASNPPSAPSSDLERVVRLNLAAQFKEFEAKNQPPPLN